MPRPRPTAVWFAEERPRKPRLSRERIVGAAVELLDAEGVEGFSMRRLAARLDAGVMSTYEYVRSKEDVLDLAVDAVIGEIEPADATAPWREALTRQLGQSREVMKRHPWIPSLMAVRPLLGPNSLARSEVFYAALVRAGLRGPRLIAAVGSLTYYVQGFVAVENIWRDWMRDPTEENELRRQAQEYIDRLAELYPTLAQHAQLGDDDFDGQFRLGLNIVLDGIEAQLDSAD